MNKENILSWIELDKKNLKNNYDFLRSKLDDDTMMAGVVKADAYGHGLVKTSRLLDEFGVDYFCVHSYEEADKLRKQDYGKPILIMGYVAKSNLKDAIEKNYRMVLYDRERLAEAKNITESIDETAYFHLKLETGTNRQGIREEEIGEFVSVFRENQGLKLEGIYTHFANIEDTTDHSYAHSQLKEYRRLAGKAEEVLEKRIPIKHTACSAAAMLFPESHFDLVRPGISMYGFWSSKETHAAYMLKYHENVENLLKPVLSFKTKVSQIKRVPAGEYIGYGCTFRATRDMEIAVLPVGYYDGYDRLLSNNSYVLIKGKRAPLVGRVCMNIIMVDVSAIENVKPEDVAVLIGNQGDECISANYLASTINTINYEIVTRLGCHLPRFVV